MKLLDQLTDPRVQRGLPGQTDRRVPRLQRLPPPPTRLTLQMTVPLQQPPVRLHRPLHDLTRIVRIRNIRNTHRFLNRPPTVHAPLL